MVWLVDNHFSLNRFLGLYT